MGGNGSYRQPKGKGRVEGALQHRPGSGPEGKQTELQGVPWLLSFLTPFFRSYVEQQASWRIWFFERKKLNFIIGQGQGQVQAQPERLSPVCGKFKFSVGIQLFGLNTTSHGKPNLIFIFEVTFTMWSCLHAKKLNTRRESYLNLVQTRLSLKTRLSLYLALTLKK